MVHTRQFVLANAPSGFPHLDGPEQTFKLTETDLPPPANDEILVKTLHLSNDPAQRGYIRPGQDPSRSYLPPIEPGQIMRAAALAEVIESPSNKFKKGDIVFVATGWSEYAVVKADSALPIQDLPGVNRTVYLGALGLTGLTAYFGLTEVVNAGRDDIVVVSGAAGATGSTVVQIAKSLLGCKKVIGIAGTDEKCRWVESLGADLCLNYKNASFEKDLAEATPGPDGFANVYYDNVGGEILDLMLGRMAREGRIAACGAISNYNNSGDRTTGVKKWFEIITMRLLIRGFIVLDYREKFGEAREVFAKAVREGKIKVDGGETVVKTKFEDIPKTWMLLFDGSNTGKLVTELV